MREEKTTTRGRAKGNWLSTGEHDIVGQEASRVITPCQTRCGLADTDTRGQVPRRQSSELFNDKCLGLRCLFIHDCNQFIIKLHVMKTNKNRE